ncbi:MAG: cation diffusion facilitator family transporter [Armatimonadota bacterium]
MKTKRGAAALSILSNSILVALKLIIGLITGSVSIISEAIHSATDLAASLIAFFSVSAADIPADEEHPFGHGKIENISGVVEAILIFVAAVYILYDAFLKFRSGREIDTLPGIIVMFVSMAANFLISNWLFKVSEETDSIALAADAHHLRIDVWTSAGVFAGLVLIKITGLFVLDPVIAVVVAGLIFKVAYDLTKEAGGPLVDIRLPAKEIEIVTDILHSEPKIVAFHKLRTRKSGAHRHIDVHLIVPKMMNIGDAHDLAEELEDRIRDRFPGAHVITHVEPDTEDNLCDTPPEELGNR